MEYNKIVSKYAFRYLLTTAASVFACLSSALFGLLAFLILSFRTNKDCADAIGNFYKLQDKREELSSTNTHLIIENCKN